MKEIKFHYDIEKMIDDADVDFSFKTYVCLAMAMLALTAIGFVAFNMFTVLESFLFLTIGMVVSCWQYRKIMKDKEKARQRLQELCNVLSQNYCLTNVHQLTNAAIVINDEKITRDHHQLPCLKEEKDIYFLDENEDIRILRQMRTVLLSLCEKESSLFLLDGDECMGPQQEVEKVLVIKKSND